jgi:hypothetical protein
MMIYRLKRDEWEKSLRLASKLNREKKMAPQKALTGGDAPQAASATVAAESVE